jgi:peptidoglycan/LPS O-acetylase OafA/YrhL
MEEILRWSTFTILGAPDVNGVNGTSKLIGGPTWSLPYEWFFYLSLPMSALFIRLIPPFIYLVVSAAGVVALVLWNPLLWHLAAFGGGIAAAFLVRWLSDSSLVNGRVGAVVALLCLGATVFDFPSPYTTAALVLLATAFTIVASGNTLFGVLSAGASRALGETSYSIYLLHSIILFVAFRFVVGYEKAASFSAIEHWLVVLGCTAVLIPACFATFHFIEAPAMRAVPGVTAWIETRLARHPKRG